MPLEKRDSEILEDKSHSDNITFRYIDIATLNLKIPSVDWDAEPIRCYYLNKQWASIIMGWVSYLAQHAAWLNAVDDNYVGVQAVLDFMLGQECCDMIAFRQHPTNDCLLQYSVDSGETWLDMFDFALCLQPTIDIITNIEIQTELNVALQQQQTIEEIYNNYVNNYVDSITNIYPELGYQADGRNANRNDALCAAISDYVDVICDLAVESILEWQQDNQELWAKIALGIAVVGAIAISGGVLALGLGAVAIEAIAGIATGIGLGAATAQIWINEIADTNSDYYQDESAKDEVKCCAYENLKDADVDQDDFQGAFSGCGSTVAAQAIANACNILAQEDVYYAAFVESLRIGLVSSELGLLESCTCEDWCWILDFTQANFSPDIVRDGSWVNGVGWQHTDRMVSGIPNTYTRSIDIEWDVANSLLPDSLTLTKVEIFYSYHAGSFSGGACENDPGLRFGRNDFASGFITYPSTRTTCPNPKLVNGNNRKWIHEGTMQLWHTGTPQYSSMRIKMHSSRSTNGTFSGDCTLEKIVLYGTGSIPTFGDGQEC